jgi:spermidine synthase
VTRLASENPLFVSLNGGSLRSPKVTVVNDDAMKWLEKGSSLYDLVFVDFPDPNSFAVGKLYTKRFYGLLKRRLAPDGAFAVQATSPLFARRSFWIIDRTIEASGFATRPYHATVPSFGEWGYVLAAPRPFDVPSRLIPDLRYLSDETLAAMFSFGPDMARWEAPVNRLHDQVLVRTYESEWRKFE